VCSALLASLNVADVGTDSNNSPPKLVAWTWTDSCGGQNKNFRVLCFFQYLILTDKFPEAGHTYSDSDFGNIEVV